MRCDAHIESSSVTTRSLPRLAAIAAVASLAFAGLTFPGAAARAQRPLQRVLDLNRQAMDAYMNLELEQAQQLLQQALQAAQQGGVSGAPLARTYLNLGAVAVGGFADNGRGLNYFVQALRADPQVELDPLTSTPEIQTVFRLAQQRLGPGGEGGSSPDGGSGQTGGSSGGGGGSSGAIHGNIPHQPVPEQLAQTALPVYVEVSGEPGNVFLFYKAHGMREFQRVEMRRIADGYGVEIPCNDVFQPALEYYIVAFAPDGTPMGFAGSQDQPVRVNIVSSRTHPAPSLPGRAPPETCTDVECPPGMEGCAGSGGGGAGQMGGTCRDDTDCGPGLMCEDDLCVSGERSGGDDGGNDAPGFFIHVGGALGAGWADTGMQADRYPASLDNPGPGYVRSGEGACQLHLDRPPEERGFCVQVATPGFVPHPVIRVAAGYYFLPFLGAAAWARFSPLSGDGAASFVTAGARLEVQLTPPVESGFHASLFAGGGGGQVQIQPPGNGDDAPYIMSGFGNVTIGGYLGYRIVRNFGFVAELDAMFMVPTFLFDLDVTVNAAVTF